MNNRENLLDRALEAFSLRGYEAVGVQEIAAAAGITKPTLYYYFGSKSGLLATLFEERFAPFLAELTQTAAYAHDVTKGLEQIARAHFTFAQHTPHLYRLYLSLTLAPVESEPFRVTREYRLRQADLMEAFFAEAAKDHGNMKGRQQAYAASFIGLLNTYITLVLNGQAKVDDQLIYKVVHQFMHGIFS